MKTNIQYFMKGAQIFIVKQFHINVYDCHIFSNIEMFVLKNIQIQVSDVWL